MKGSKVEDGVRMVGSRGQKARGVPVEEREGKWKERALWWWEKALLHLWGQSRGNGSLGKDALSGLVKHG